MHYLLLFLTGIMSADENRYQLRDFYCYDEKAQAEVLLLLPKVFFLKTDDSFNSLSVEEQKNFFLALNLGDKLVNISEPWEKKALLLEYDPNVTDQNALLNFLSTFSDYQAGFLKKQMGIALPVFIWRGQEVIAVRSIIFETWPSIAEPEVLKEIMSKFGKFEVADVRQIDGQVNQYQADIVHLESPFNIFILANLMSENKIYFKWAHPVFIPINSGIVAKEMFVTANGLDTLGDRRYLHLEIHIFNPKISLRKDLMPRLGQGEFVPNRSTFEDVWFWAGEPVIKEESYGYEKVTSFVWPFVYLDTGDFSIKDIAIAYDEEINGEVVGKSVLMAGGAFQIGSVLAGAKPPIIDIQPARDYYLFPEKETISKTDNKSSYDKYRDWLFLAIGLVGGTIMIYFGWTPLALAIIKANQKTKELAMADSRYWNELLRLSDALTVENWERQYLLIEVQLKIVLAKFFGLGNNVCLESLPSGADYRMGMILKELERVYRDEGDLKQDDIIKLKEVISSFVVSFDHGRRNDV